MILQNSKGIEREVLLLFKIEKDNHNYLVYKDVLTNKIYAGLMDKEKLLKISSEEINYLDELLKRIN